MKNIKCLVLTLLAVWSTCVIAQDVKKYTFDDNVPLTTDWKVEKDVPSEGAATCEITNSIGGSLTAKEGNYLGFAYLKSKTTISVTSTAEFTNITSVGLDVAANDNGKPTFSVLIVDANGNTIATLADNVGSKDGFATGGTKKWGHADFAANGVKGYLKIQTYASSSGKYAAIDNITITHSAGPAGPVAVTGVSLDKTSLTIEAGQTAQLTATVQPANADNQAVTWSSSDNAVASVDPNGNVTANAKGTATITVTTADGNKTATCAVTVTEPAAPIEVTAIALKASTTIAIGDTETLIVTYTPADANTGKALTWKSDNTAVATVDVNGVVKGIKAGTATITATSTTNPAITASCTVTVQAVAVTGVTLSKTAINLQIGGTETLTASILPENATIKDIIWNTTDATIATVNNGTVTGIKAGTTIVSATIVNGNKTANCTVTVTAGPPVPSTSLTTHVPEIYEAKELAGGYGGTLSVVNGREYEVYYVTRDAESNLTVATTPVEKVPGVCTSISENETKAKDGWFTLKTNGTSGSTNGVAKDEFETSIRCAKLLNNQTLEMHIKGFDQFSFYGKDNNAAVEKGRHFELYIDDVKQNMAPNTSYSIRRFDITTGEHVIRLVGIGGSNNEITSFSLRLAEEPRTKWLKGNDSTQVIMQTAAPKPVYYFTKYNAKGETKLIWDGAEATGINLTTQASGALGDTLVLSGTANCPTGEYKYHVAAFYNGVETSRASGKFIVASEIKAITDTIVDAYQNEEMDQIQFRYYALSENDVTLTWNNGTAPAGITGSGSNGKYIIGGTPTAVGTYDFTISVTGGNSIQGKIVVRALDLGNNPVLYLYKNNLAYESDGVYLYLSSPEGGKKNLIPRKAREDGLRPAEQYAKYKWIIISEDVDANNAEVLAIAKGGANLPVLNLKSFTYSPGRLEWGEPNNGSLTDNGRHITVQRADHPIFKSMLLSQGEKVEILKEINLKGLMPIHVQYDKTLCLATALTRNIDNYNGDGELETFLHEIPADLRGGNKYICLPIAQSSSQKLSDKGKALITSIVNYITSNESTVELPVLKITNFKLLGVEGKIDQVNNMIEVAFDITKYPDLDLTMIIPEITVESKFTHTIPYQGEAIDFTNSIYSPVTIEVTDYINKRIYGVVVKMYNPQGIDDVYTVGQWVNIYDIYGRKISTTNEDIYTMSLPRGVYLVVTETGETIKIMR